MTQSFLDDKDGPALCEDDPKEKLANPRRHGNPLFMHMQGKEDVEQSLAGGLSILPPCRLDTLKWLRLSPIESFHNPQ
jgi:hypothetical protein